ncbi:MAG: 2Fe-2S iron-sulfur cluster binding domain-containing protein [Candidatus Omnitrophica bacterium]|nr:2Fe-2S iron-sulfur cluster binding domain-containing protein [Candidatus Omnitrophota bacterium]
MSTVTMIKAIINGKAVKVPQGTSILDAARKVQVKIPTLCKHPDLSPSAGCGICIVKVKGNRKMLRACCTPIEEGMDIITHDPEIVQTRFTVLELILSNHPTDCLICGRNNDCELQKISAEFGIREDVFERIVPEIPVDKSTGTIILDPRKCIKCGRCIDACQNMQDVWALSFIDRGFKTRMSPAGDIKLAESPCVRCGQCSAHCPTGAIFEHDDTRKVWEALQDPEKVVVVQVAPAVRVAVGEGFDYPVGTNLTKKLYSAFRRLGFKAIFDTNFGADLTILEEAGEFVERFVHGKAPLPLITTCCPSWVDYMEKYYGDMIQHFSSAKSPHEMVGVLSKTYYAQKQGLDPSKIVMVSIMPCTSKKYEITRTNEMFASGYQDVDFALTTRELIRMLKHAGIDFRHLPDEEPDSILGDYTGAGTIFGATGGVMEAALRTAYFNVTGENLQDVKFQGVRGLEGVKETTVNIKGTEVKIAVAHGLANVKFVMDKVRAALKNNQPIPYHFIEVMACPGGCVGGGGQPYMVTDEIRKQRAKGLYDEDEAMTKRCSHENPYVQQLYKEFLEKPLSHKSHELLHTTYKARPLYVK